MAAPNLADLGEIDRTAYELIPVDAQEWPGHVWVCLAVDPPFFTESVQCAVTSRLGDSESIELQLAISPGGSRGWDRSREVGASVNVKGRSVRISARWLAA